MNKLKMKTTATLLIAIFILSTFAVAIPVSATPITVDDSGGAHHTTIQAAIDAAAADDIITVAAGLYEEDLSIPDTLTNLELSGATGAIIKGVEVVLSINFPAGPPNIEIIADGVILHGFTIESPNVLATYTSHGIVIHGIDVEIYDNDFVSYATGSGENVAIQTLHADNGGDVSRLSIYDNTFSGSPAVGYVGIYVNPDLDVSSNYVTIEGNTFTGYLKQGIITERSYTEILDNTIITDQSNLDYGNGIGVYDWDLNPQSDVLVSGNLVTGSSSGLGFNRGIFTGMVDLQTQTNIVITENTVQGNNWGVLVRSTPAGVLVNHNNILDNIYGVENTETGTLDATLNWWGTSVGTQIDDMVSGDVNYTPWLGGSVLPLTGEVTGWTLTKAFDGTGTGDFTLTPSSPSDGYANEEVVTLAAIPDGDSVFTGWVGVDVDLGDTATVTMTSDRTVTATFALIPVISISITPPDPITLSGTIGSSVTDLATVTVTNTGNQVIDVTATLAGTDVVFFETCLMIDASIREYPYLVGALAVEPDSGYFMAVNLGLDLTSYPVPGTYSATLVFWAEESTP